MRFSVIFLSFFLLLACGKKADQMTPDESGLTYLALGDSYTIGEAVSQKESFPYQLTALLNSKGMNFASPQIVAKTGWTTGELQMGINTGKLAKPYDLVTLLIGVNNQYRGASITEYRKEFSALLTQAISFAGGDKAHVFVISIPDWGVTPYGKQSGRDQRAIAQEIDSFNAVNKEVSLSMGIDYTDITPASREAETSLSLIATDGLHPSGKMYSQWATALATKIKL